MRNIYFSGSIRGGRDDVDIYHEIIKILSNHGHVFTAYIGDKSLDPVHGEGKSDQFIWERDISWVRQSDTLIAEVSQPSHGVGYEIAIASQLSIPVLALYYGNSRKKVSAMIGGDPHISCMKYRNIKEINKIIDNFFNSLI